MLFSIITVCYNSSKTIVDTLQSVAEQNYPLVEHILIDGASKDNTVSIIQSFSHVKKIISEKDNGLYDAMNKGLELATGDVIGILNSDDFYFSNDILKKASIVFKENPNIQIVYANLLMVQENNLNKTARNWISEPYYPLLFDNGKMIPHPTVFIRREVYEKHGNFDLQFKLAADYDLLVRFLKNHKVSSHYVSEYWVKMRMGGSSNRSLKQLKQISRETLLVWKKNGNKITLSYLYGRFIFTLKQWIR